MCDYNADVLQYMYIEAKTYRTQMQLFHTQMQGNLIIESVSLNMLVRRPPKFELKQLLMTATVMTKTTKKKRRHIPVPLRSIAFHPDAALNWPCGMLLCRQAQRLAASRRMKRQKKR